MNRVDPGGFVWSARLSLYQFLPDLKEAEGWGQKTKTYRHRSTDKVSSGIVLPRLELPVYRGAGELAMRAVHFTKRAVVKSASGGLVTGGRRP